MPSRKAANGGGKRWGGAGWGNRGSIAAAVALFRWLGWRRTLLVAFFAGAFGVGFYSAQLYADISRLIEQRKAALTSAIYSAPLKLNPGDKVGPLHLIDRLSALSYTRVENPAHPGEYSMVPGAMTIYVREFSTGVHGYAATITHLI